MAGVEATDVTTTLTELFLDVHNRFREQVRGLDHGTLNWRPLPKANSIAVLVTHSLGSEREVLLCVRSLESTRDRDSEFKVEHEAAELLEQIDEADRAVREHLAAVTAEDLNEPRSRPNHEPRSGLTWLVGNYGHTREHLAQIELTKQLYDSRT